MSPQPRGFPRCIHCNQAGPHLGDHFRATHAAVGIVVVPRAHRSGPQFSLTGAPSLSVISDDCRCRGAAGLAPRLTLMCPCEFLQIRRLPRTRRPSAGRPAAPNDSPRADAPAQRFGLLGGVAHPPANPTSQHVGFGWAAGKLATLSATSPATAARPPTCNRTRARRHRLFAVRILAWLYVIWHRWQDGVPRPPNTRPAIP